MNEFLALIIGLLAGIVGAISSGGGLLSIPCFIFMGVPPITAIATTRLGSAAGGFSSIYRYHRDNLIHWRYLPLLAPISCLAGIIGPRLLIQINQETVKNIVGVALLLLFVLLFYTKEFGLITKVRHRAHKAIGSVLVFFAMIYATMFGAGGGAIVINIVMFFFGMKVNESTATGMSVWLVGTTVAAIAYSMSGAVDFSLAIPLMLGSVVGGYIGAHVAVIKGNAWAKKILAIMVLLSGIKILFF
jgi:uncharacterized protein